MTKKTILSLLIIGGLCSCNFSSNDEKKVKKLDINKFKIVNHTSNEYIKNEIIDSELADIKKIKEQLELLKPVEPADMKNNHGLYELILFNKDGMTKTIEVTFTIYDGVIIRDELGQSYKNNKLESLLTSLLQ